MSKGLGTALSLISFSQIALCLRPAECFKFEYSSSIRLKNTPRKRVYLPQRRVDVLHTQVLQVIIHSGWQREWSWHFRHHAVYLKLIAGSGTANCLRFRSIHCLEHGRPSYAVDVGYVWVHVLARFEFFRHSKALPPMHVPRTSSRLHSTLHVATSLQICHKLSISTAPARQEPVNDSLNIPRRAQYMPRELAVNNQHLRHRL